MKPQFWSIQIEKFEPPLPPPPPPPISTIEEKARFALSANSSLIWVGWDGGRGEGGGERAEGGINTLFILSKIAGRLLRNQSGTRKRKRLCAIGSTTFVERLDYL